MLGWLALGSITASAVEIPHQSFTLDNGLKVILMEDHSIPKVVVNTWFGVGSYDDPPGASGFAHLFEHLMFMGTEQIPEGRFDALMEQNGGQNNASTGDDRTNYYDWGTSNILELLLWMEADRMTGLRITQKKLDLQREVVRNERRQNYEDRPYGGIWLNLPEMMYPTSHPYHYNGIGSHEHLLNASLDHVKQFYSDWYRPNNATLVIAGDFEPTKTKEWVNKYFSEIPKGAIIDHVKAPEVNKPQIKERTITDKIQLPALVMAWHSPAYFATGDADLDVAANVLTGGEDARLTKRLKQVDKLAQSVYAFQSSSKRGSMFVVMAYAKPDADLGKIKEIVFEELGNLGGKNPPTEVELKRSQTEWEMSFIEELESLESRAESLQNCQYHTGQPGCQQKDLERYLTVSSDGVKQAVQRYLTQEKAAFLYVKPEKKSEAK